MEQTKCIVCFKIIPQEKKLCPSCSSFLKFSFSEIGKYLEIVNQIDEISKINAQDLQDNALSTTIKVFELIDQIEDQEIRNTASRIIQLIMDKKVQFDEKRKKYRTENDGESLKLELLEFRDTILDELNDIIKKNYYKVKTPALKVLLAYSFNLCSNIS